MTGSLLNGCDTTPREQTNAFVVDEATGCWIWQLGLGKRGYPFGRVYRRYYAEAKGPIPEGWHVHHVCRNRACVNPDHLEAIDPLAHRKHHQFGLTDEQFAEFLEAARTPGVRYVDLMARFDLKPSTTMRLLRGISWADLTGGPVEVAPRVCASPYCENSLDHKRRQARYCSPLCRQRTYAWERGVKPTPRKWGERERAAQRRQEAA